MEDPRVNKMKIFIEKLKQEEMEKKAQQKKEKKMKIITKMIVLKELIG